jgi:hypothetical protein
VKSKLHQCTYILLVSNFNSQVDVEVSLQVYFQRMGTSPLNSICVGYDPHIGLTLQKPGGKMFSWRSDVLSSRSPQFCLQAFNMCSER